MMENLIFHLEIFFVFNDLQIAFFLNTTRLGLRILSVKSVLFVKLGKLI